MTAVELMDSRKFMALRTDYYNAIQHEDEAKETEYLQAILDMANGESIRKPLVVATDNVREDKRFKDKVVEIVEFTDIKPKRKRRTKAEMAQAKEPRKVELVPPAMTLKERRSMADEATRLQAQTVPASVVLDEFVKTKLYPEYAKGTRKFNIPEQYKQRMLTVNPELWENTLRANGVNFTELDWSYPTGTVENPVIPEGYWPLALK